MQVLTVFYDLYMVKWSERFRKIETAALRVDGAVVVVVVVVGAANVGNY